jgi:HAD superfamily hydrolase (TIGR01509 family)
MPDGPFVGIRAVLFDMDGVLTNNSEWHSAAWVLCARELLGIAIQPDDTRIHGGLNHEILATLLGRPPSAADAQAFHDAKEARYRSLARGKVKPVRGLAAYLDLLEHLSLPTALVTSADPVNIAFVLGELGMESRFALRVTGADVRRGKPDPEAFERGAALVGVPPGECLVHEDSPNGVKSAVSAGARVAALTTTTTAARLFEAGAAWASPDFEAWMERRTTGTA